MPIEADDRRAARAVGDRGPVPARSRRRRRQVRRGRAAGVRQVVRQSAERGAGRGRARATPSDDTIREAMRLNTELAKSVIERFPEMMHAAAELLRAADGAGLPAREPRASRGRGRRRRGRGRRRGRRELAAGLRADQHARRADRADRRDRPRGKKLPSLAAMLDWRKASPQAAKPATEAPRHAPTGRAPRRGDAAHELPPLDPATMAHVIAIQSALAPAGGRARAPGRRRAVAPPSCARGSTSCRRCRVPDAVAKIRALIAGKAEVRRDRPAVQRPACLGSITEVVAELVKHRGSGDRRARGEARDDRRASRRGSARCRSAMTTASGTTAPRSRRASRRSGCASRRRIRTASSAPRSTSPSPS